MARKVRLTQSSSPNPSRIAATAPDPAHRRTWIVLGVVALWLAVVGFFSVKNAAGQTLWYVPVEVLAAYGILYGISRWRRSCRPAQQGTPSPSGPIPMATEYPSSTAPRGVESIEERLTRLSEMKDKGLITQAEYQTRRREIIGEG